MINTSIMPEITRATQSYRRSKEQHRRVRRIVVRSLVFVIIVVLAVTSFGYYRYANALPLLSAQITAGSYAPPAPQPLAWPGYGQAAVGTEAFGLLETH